MARADNGVIAWHPGRSSSSGGYIGQKKHLQRALPYLIEENLIGNVEEQHIVGLPEPGRDTVLVGYLPVAVMQELMDTLTESGLEPASIVPENSLWHVDNQTIMLLFEQEMVTIASYEKSAQTMDCEALPLLFRQYLHPELVGQDVAVSVDDDNDRLQTENTITAIKVLSEHNESKAHLARVAALAGDGVKTEHQDISGGSVLSALASLLSEQRQAMTLMEFAVAPSNAPKRLMNAGGSGTPRPGWRAYGWHWNWCFIWGRGPGSGFRQLIITPAIMNFTRVSIRMTGQWWMSEIVLTVC